MPGPIKKKSLVDIAKEDTEFKPKSAPAVGGLTDEELSIAFSGPEKKNTQPISKDLEVSVQEPGAGSKEMFGDNYIDPKSKVGNDFFSPQSTGVDNGPDPNLKPLVEKERVDSEQADKEKEEEIAKLDNGISRPISAIATFNQHVYGLPADILETVAIGADQLGNLTEMAGLGKKAPIEDQYASKIAKWYRDSIKELSPDNPAYQDELQTQVSGSLGDLTTLVMSGGTSRTPQAINEIQKFSKTSNLLNVATQEGKSLISSPPALVGAIQMGTNEFRQAKASGATDDQAFDAFYKNAAAGSILERVPIMKYWKRLDQTTSGGLKKLISNGATQGVEEMTTEVIQQAYSNINAAQSYDATRKWYDGMTESGGIGFGLGFFLGAMGTSLRKKQAEAKTPEEKAELQKSIDFVNEKGEELASKQEKIDAAETNAGAEKGAESEVSKVDTDKSIGEKTIPETDQGVIDVTGQQEIIPGKEGVKSSAIPTQEPADEALQGKDVALYKDDGDFNSPEDWELNEDTDDYENVGHTKNFTLKFEKDAIVFDFKDPEKQSIQEDKLGPIKVNLEHRNFNRVHISGIASPLLNKGYGKEIYRGLVKQNGIISTSDGASSTEDAQRVWNSLIKSGDYYWAKKGPHTAIATSKEEIDKYIDSFLEDKFSDEPLEVGSPVRNESSARPSVETVTEPLEKPATLEGNADLPAVETDPGTGQPLDAGPDPASLSSIVKNDPDFVPPTPPETKTTTSGDSEQKERRFTKQVLNSPEVNEDVKSNITEEAKKYTPKSNEDTNSAANRIIKDKDISGALNTLLDKNSLISPAVRVALGNNIIKQANKAASEAKTEIEKNKHLDAAISAAEFMGPYMTEIGQGVQAASMFSKLSPEGVLRAVEKEVSRQRTSNLDHAQPHIDKIKEIISGLTEESIAAILELPRVRDIIIDKSGKIEGATKKKTVKKAIDFLETLKVDTKGKAFDATAGLPIAVWNGAISSIQTSLQAGATIAEAINKAVKYIKDKHNSDWDEKSFRSKFDQDLKPYEASIDPSKAVKRGLKDLEIDIKDIIKKHYTKVDEAKHTLVQKLVDDAGLDEVDAKEVAKNIEHEFDKLTSKAKKSALNKAVNAKDRIINKKNVDQLHEKIIKESNIGNLTDDQYREIYADKMGLPQLTKEQAGKLMSLAEKVQTSQEGFQKRRAIEELLKYQDTIKGINWMDVGTSIWYSNILSGFTTQEINFFANLMETMGEFYTAAVYNPQNIPFLMKGLYTGWGRGLLESIDTLKTGYAPIKGVKVDTPNILERVKFKGGNWNPFNQYKYVKRVMDAADVFSYQGLREMRAYELAATEARKQGKDKPNDEIWGKVYEKLYNTSDRRKEAEIQAKEEGLSGNDYNRRVLEIMDQSRPADMMEDAGTAASRGTFNYDPEGTIGFLGDQIASLIEKAQYKGFKPFKFIVPFTRIVANVSNRYLDWSPVGFYRAAKGGTGTFVPDGSRYQRSFTKEERVKEYIKATSGALAMMTLYAMTQKMSEDDDPALEITSEGTGDFKDNYELAKNGWQKYSIKVGDKWISYQNTPFAIPFSIIGHMRDDEKYKGKSLDSKDAIDRLSIALVNNLQFVTDMTFLKGMGDFMGSFSNENPNAVVNYFDKLRKTTIKGFAVPNLYTQSAKEIQRIYGIPTKEANTLLEAIIRDIPIANSGQKDMIDALGDPIIADTDRLTSDVESDAAWDVIIKNNAWIGRVNKHSTTIYDKKTKKERPMTDQEYYDFSKERGQVIKKKILKNIKELSEKTPSKVRDEITEYKKVATKKAKKVIK
jgi:hypothetical protein